MLGKKSRFAPKQGSDAESKQYIQIGIAVALLLATGLLLFKVRVWGRTSTSPDGVSPSGTLSLQAMVHAAGILDSELMTSAPPNGSFNPAYKNPCWEVNGNLKCLPQFYVMGNYFSGSLSLASKLAAHPAVLMEEKSLEFRPEIKFWGEYRNTLSGYLSIFDVLIPKIKEDPKSRVIMDGAPGLFAVYFAASGKAHRAFSSSAVPCWKVCHDTHGGSAGPTYEWCMDKTCLPAAREADRKAAAAAGISYDDAQLPMLMRAVYGDRLPKFVLLLRDPAARMYSDFFARPHFTGKYGNSSEGFVTYVKEQHLAFKECVARNHTDVECALYFETLGMDQEKVFYHTDQFLRGMYSIYLEVWFRYFPRDAFLIIKAEDYFAQPDKILRSVLEFLDLAEPHASQWAVMANAGTRTSYAQGRPIPQEAHQILRQFYQLYNERLAAMLKDDRYRQWSEAV